MTTLARRRAFFLSTYAVTALLLAFPLASASATTSGVDTPLGVTSLPLAVEGTAVMTLTPGVATVNGSVGIGMASPGSPLQVNGGTAIGFATSTAAPANGLTVEGDVGIGLVSPGSPLQVNGGTAIGYSTSTAAPANGLAVNGKVGIGVTAPAYQLDVQGSAGTIHGSGRFFSGAAGTGGMWVDGGSSQFVGSESGTLMGFYNNGWNLLLDNNGNLTVAGTVTVEGSTITNATVNVANALLNPSCGSNEALSETANHTFTCVTIANLAQIGPATVPNCAGMVPPEALTWNGTGFSCVATAVTPPASLWTALSGNIYNTSLTGNVGINTTTPGTTLEVNGAITSDRNWIYLAGPGDTNHAVGNLLSVNGNDAEQFRFWNFLDLLPAQTGNSAMRILSNGNVGINTTTPQTTLDVNGPVNTGLQAAGASCTGPLGAMGHDASGNVLSCSNSSGGQVWTPVGAASTIPGTTSGLCIEETGEAVQGNAYQPSTQTPLADGYSLCNTQTGGGTYPGIQILEANTPAYGWWQGGSPGGCSGPWYDKTCSSGTVASAGCSCATGYIATQTSGYLITTGYAYAASTNPPSLTDVENSPATYCAAGKVISVPVTYTTCTKM